MVTQLMTLFLLFFESISYPRFGLTHVLSYAFLRLLISALICLSDRFITNLAIILRYIFISNQTFLKIYL
nr:hypothetical protein CJ183_20175 [Acinetobacter ursingii]